MAKHFTQNIVSEARRFPPYCVCILNGLASVSSPVKWVCWLITVLFWGLKSIMETERLCSLSFTVSAVLLINLEAPEFISTSSGSGKPQKWIFLFESHHSVPYFLICRGRKFSCYNPQGFFQIKKKKKKADNLFKNVSHGVLTYFGTRSSFWVNLSLISISSVTEADVLGLDGSGAGAEPLACF